ncbi:MAG: hypothetical protein WCF94_04105 [bacterium]
MDTTPMKTAGSSIFKWSLILGAIIVFSLFLAYSISLIKPAPKFEDFCTQSQQKLVTEIKDSQTCQAKGGQWTEYAKPAASGIANDPITGYCDQYFTCNKDFSKANSTYEKNVFIVYVIVGVILLVASLFLAAINQTLMVSASLAGILTLVIASIRYWNEAKDWLRVVILFVALSAIITLIVRKFKDR